MDKESDMKRTLAVLFLLVIFGLGVFSYAEAAVRSRGYFRSNGTYVQPYYRTIPNRNLFDNYSTKGNYNPYTGKKGYVNPFR